MTKAETLSLKNCFSTSCSLKAPVSTETGVVGGRLVEVWANDPQTVLAAFAKIERRHKADNAGSLLDILEAVTEDADANGHALRCKDMGKASIPALREAAFPATKNHG